MNENFKFGDVSKTKNTDISNIYKSEQTNTENNNSIISIIQWVIGIAAAFLLAILGSQIFFNWRINKKEIDFIKKDIDEKIGELKAELIKNYAETNREQNTLINVGLDKIEREIKQKITDQLDNNSELSKVQEKAREREIELIKKEISTEIKSLKIDINKNEGDIWNIRGIDANALSSYISMALLKIELGKEVKYALQDIISTLEKREEVYEGDYNRLDDLINKLNDKYNDQKGKIISLYKHKPVYKWVDIPEERRSSSANELEKKYIKNKSI